MPTITCRLPPTLHERALAECEKRDVKLSDVLREFLERWVDHLDDAKTPGGPVYRGAPALVNSAPGKPKPMGFAVDGTPIYPKTGPLRLEPKAKKERG